MPDKQKSAQKSRASKKSSGSARGSKPIHLTPLQKILLVNGGVGHKVLRSRDRVSGFKLHGKTGRPKIPASLRPDHSPVD